VVIDELAFYLNTGNRKRDEAIATALRDLVARGRKTGIIVLAATQRPSHDVVPTSIRDLFAYRWAFRCTTPDASDTILGRGHAAQGFNAAEIPAEQRGVGWLRAEGTHPVRLRTYYLTDEQIDQLAADALQLRHLAARAGRPSGRLRADLRRIDLDTTDAQPAGGEQVQDDDTSPPTPGEEVA
jgi:S-DNA-T family DNA segregation ATPase FtsK/SpoIIIE